MPRNGSGNYNAPASTWNPSVPGTTILSPDWNALLSDLSLAITQSVASDGQTATSVKIPFAQGIAVASGTVASPAISFIGDANTGFYSPSADQIGVVIGGASVGVWTSTTLTLSGNLAAASGSYSGNLVVSGNTTLGNAPADTVTVEATATFNGSAIFNGLSTFIGAVNLPNETVSNAELQHVPTQTIKGRVTAGTGDPEDLTATQATSILNAFVGDSGSGGTKGLVPAPAAGDAAQGDVLRADGTWGNELKAWAKITGTTVDAGRNVASVTNPGIGAYTVTFTTALASTNYAVFLSPADQAIFEVGTQATGSVGAVFYDAAGAPLNVTGFFIQVLA